MDYLTTLHEQRHTLFYYDPNYREKVEKIWFSLDKKSQEDITKFLEDLGYPKYLHLDEFQAYLTTEKVPERFFSIKNLNQYKFQLILHKTQYQYLQI